MNIETWNNKYGIGMKTKYLLFIWNKDILWHKDIRFGIDIRNDDILIRFIYGELYFSYKDLYKDIIERGNSYAKVFY